MDSWNHTDSNKRSAGYVARPPMPANPPDLIDVHGLARLLGSTPTAVYKALYRGEIPANCVVRIGRRVRFRSDSITAWLDSLTGKAAA